MVHHLPIVVAAALLGTSAWTAADLPSGVVVHEAFDADLSSWVVGTHLPDDPNNPEGGAVASAATISAENVNAGAGALRLYIDGRQDDGTLWVARPVGTLDGAADLTLRFQFHSPFGGSFNNLAYAVAYIGTRPPQVEDDFVRVAPVTDVDGWEELTHAARLDGVAGDTVWVAAGFSVVWESEQTYFIDDLVVEASDAATAVAAASWAHLKERHAD